MICLGALFAFCEFVCEVHLLSHLLVLNETNYVMDVC